MLSIMVTVLAVRQPPSYTLRFDDSTDHTRNSVYQNLTEQNLSAQLKERLSLSADEIQKIIANAKAQSPHQQYYPVDEATYKLVLG
jgi:hypothetical protein